MMPFSHDEVVHGKRSLLDQMPGDLWQKIRQFAFALQLPVDAPGQKAVYSWAANSASGTNGIAIANCNGNCWVMIPTRVCGRLVSDLNHRMYREYARALNELDFDPQWF